ncbi:MAG: glycosyltransferase family 39 protein [Elusimicrobiota bacterium]
MISSLRQGVFKFNTPVALMVLLCVAVLTFFPVLNNGFTNWDDDLILTDNPVIKTLSLKNVYRIFSEPCNFEYRPFLYLLLSIEYSFVKLNPVLYHLTSLLFHLLNCVLAFYFIYLVTHKNVVVAFIAGILFAVHPVQVQSVAWISGRDDVMYFAFYMLSLIFYVKYLEADNKKYYLLAILSFICSMLSKTLAMTLPVMLLLVCFFLKKKVTWQDLVKTLPFWVMDIILCYIALTVSTLQMPAMQYWFDTKIMSTFDELVFYMYKLFYPIDFSYLYFDYRVLSSPYLSLLLVVSMLGIVWYTRKFTDKVVFGMLWFLLTILPLLKIMTSRPVCDHRLYLSSLGIFYIAGEVFFWVFKKTGVISAYKEKGQAGA